MTKWVKKTHEVLRERGKRENWKGNGRLLVQNTIGMYEILNKKLKGQQF